jgi:curved DNA-binding protein CbpA
MIPNYYKILGVGRYENKDELKKKYRKLALEWHPDKNVSPDAHHMFIEINEAYLILYDEEARIKYNREYDYYYGAKKRASESKTKFRAMEEHAKEQTYCDEDLNNWSKTARNQGEKYASISFNEFSEMVKVIIKEVGIQGVTALIYAIAGVIGASSMFSFFSGIYYGDVPQIILSAVLFGLAIIGFNLSSKRYL